VNEPDIKRGIYRVTHFMRSHGQRWACESDLIFVDGRPVLVVEWTPPDGRDPPVVTAPLDPARLQELPTRFGHFLYDDDVEDPRRLQ